MSFLASIGLATIVMGAGAGIFFAAKWLKENVSIAYCPPTKEDETVIEKLQKEEEKRNADKV